MNTGKSLEGQQFEACYEAIVKRNYGEQSDARAYLYGTIYLSLSKKVCELDSGNQTGRKQLRKELQKDIMWNFWNYRIL